MTERSLYPNRVEVQQEDLVYTESTKSAQLRQRTVDIITGRVEGLVVTVNTTTNTLVDVSAGRAYPSGGEQAVLTTTQTGIALSDYTLDTDNFVTISYTETETDPAPTEVGSTTRNTRTVQVALINVYTLAEFNALPATLPDDLSQIAQDRSFIIATVNANGAGVALTANDITQSDLGGDVVVGSVTATRIVITSTDQVDLISADAPLVVGPGTGAHLEVGANGVQWKINQTLGGTLVLNPLGGDVNAFGNLTVGEALSVTSRISSDSNLAVDLTDALAPLRIGPAASAHLEVGNNGLQFKGSETTTATMNLNPLGGFVIVGSSGLVSGGDVSASGNLVSTSTDTVDLVNGVAPLRLGNTTTAHIEADTGNIQAKSNATTPTGLNLNPFGGSLFIGESNQVNGDTVFLRNQRTTVDGNESIPLHIQNSQDGVPAIGSAQDCALQVERSDAEPLASLGYNASQSLLLRGFNHGAPFIVQLENASGVLTTSFSVDPDFNTEIYHAGTQHIATQTLGSDAVTGAVIRHRDGVDYDVGLGVTPLVSVTTNRTITVDDCAKLLIVAISTVEITFATDATIPIGAWGYIFNTSVADIDLNAGGGVVLERFDTETTVGSFDLSPFGWAKWFKIATSNYGVMGVGFVPAPSPAPW